MAQCVQPITLWIFVCGQLGFICRAAPGHDHDHGSHGHSQSGQDCTWTKRWEWSGAFQLKGGLASWNAEKGLSGSYAENTMKLLVLSASSASAAGLEAAEIAAEQAWNGTFQPAQPGARLSPGNGYILNFDQESWVSHYKVDVPAQGKLAFFAEHAPSEFEHKLHYLIAADGEDVYPKAIESKSTMACAQQTSGAVHAHEEEAEVMHERWGEVIGASLITILPTLLGILFLAITISQKVNSQSASRVLHIVNSGASGAVFACAVFLLMPEASLYIAIDKDEATAAGTWGSAVLAGWFMGVLIDHGSTLIGMSFDRSSVYETDAATEEAKSNDLEADQKKPQAERQFMSIAGPVLFGDAFHNLADGFVIGTAFKGCDSGLAWKITAITMLHEIPQELADFLVLVSRARMRWSTATLFNFVSGLTTLLGALIAHGANVSTDTEGITLAAGAGIYIYIACTELGPSVSHVQGSAHPFKDSLSRIIAFVVGATSIGLVLLDHQHCAVGDAHAGHNH